MLIDTHYHLDLMENMHLLIREFRSIDVGIMAVGTTPKAYEKEKKFCSGVNNIIVSLGLHPQLIAERGQEIGLFLKLMRGNRHIGEIGLDFNSDFIATKDQQLFCFQKIAKSCADEGNKVISIHSVKAAGITIKELEKARTFQNNICIFHWFTGTAAERQRAIDDGAWFSVNPRMLKTKSGQETIRAIPADRVLLETDAPFAVRINSVADLQVELERLIDGISTIRGENIKKQVEKNAMIIMN